ncbi:transglutaminase family protein [Sediminibacterium ginsengisoli]|uniref:transglutaminase family protein n=1 Tax=Sediminibacterium ginsengisoli TaxID=413434 RepID=UPI00159048DA|nr:transglutaminase family protein [Sediminibacterium ginsengisoli]
MNAGYCIAQQKYGYSQFDKPLLGFQQFISTATPQPAAFTQPNIGLTAPRMLNEAEGASVQRQNEMLIKEANQMIEKSNNAPRSDISNAIEELTNNGGNRQATSYYAAFNALLKMNPDSFSLTKAVYLIENAYFNGQLRQDTYMQEVQNHCKQVAAILKSEGLNRKDNIALNYAIQKLFANSSMTKTVSVKTPAIRHFSYDFEDFRGEHDYTKMFVSKALATGKGQCHSLPLVYLILAEQLDAKASLALAPQHSFIQFNDRANRRVNFEATSGHIVSSSWLMQSGFITSVALKKKTFLSPLSTRQLYSQMLVDLMLGYLSKFRYDGFAEEVRRKIQEVNPDNLSALIIDANSKTLTAKEKVYAAGKPKESELQKHPAAFQAVQQMQLAYERLEAVGYQDMPEEAYKKWLQSIELEKGKQSGRAAPNLRASMNKMLNE